MDRRRQPHGPDSRHRDVASEEGGRRAAIMYTLIETARLNDVDPEAWLADVIARIADPSDQSRRPAAALELGAEPSPGQGRLINPCGRRITLTAQARRSTFRRLTQI
jgi:IS66 C-terminal element